MGVEHVEIGELWARKSALPLMVQRVMRYHYEPLYLLSSFVGLEEHRGVAPAGLGDLVSLRQGAAGEGPRGHVIPFPSRGENPSHEKRKGPPKKLTILIVEDHNSLCEMLSLYFMRFGYHVRTANDGESALEIIANEEIHLVLLDLMLPRLDGFTVLRQLRGTSGRKTPYVIVVSAGASERDRNKVLELGANEYMPKPFHLARLIERIRAVEKHLL